MDWYAVKEQSAGKWRLSFLWYLYKICGLSCLKAFLRIVVFFISLFAKAAKDASKNYRAVLWEYQKKHNLPLSRFSPYGHILSYAWALADRMSVLCDKKTPVRIKVDENDDWRDFMELLAANRGAFLLCSHLGNIEIMAALPKLFPNYPAKTMHAVMQISQNSVFYRFVDAMADHSLFKLHAAEGMDFAEIMGLYENLENGDLVMMAGDRVSAQNRDAVIEAVLLGKKCRLPRGAFLFAKKMRHPVFAVFMLSCGSNRYRLCVHKIDVALKPEAMAAAYCSFLEEHLKDNPQQWHNFYSFFTD